MKVTPPLAVLVVLLGALPFMPTTAAAQAPPDIVRDTEAVVLTGLDFPSWAAPADQPVKANSLEGAQCIGGVPGPDTPVTSSDPCSHNTYEEPDLSTQAILGAEGTPIDRLLGYRWDVDSGRFTQVPFQVDEMFARHLSNDASGFSPYSETDRHVSYAFDREGFRWTASSPSDPCLASPASEVATDPVPGLDTDDELAFMWRDTGQRAPSDATLPKGITDVREVAVTDPTTGGQTYLYVMQASEGGPNPAFDASNGYVRYERDEDANVFLFSESSYEDYGNAPHGPWYDPETGECHTAESQWRQRRPGDQATVTTPRYRFRYEGRWLMTALEVSQAPDGDWTYGPDLVDQWKARAFQQRPGGETPCCGYEEEVNNWGGSSMLLGERAGPVRVIRETWGADSGTNVVRREIFYRDEIRFQTFLRVHVIPPLDGIYTQWDHNAMVVDTYYNPHVPDGVPIDGKSDEVFGNSRAYLGEEGVSVQDPIFDEIEDVTGAPVGEGIELCRPDTDCAGGAIVDNDIDTPDPTLSGANALLSWEQVSGAHGSLVTRWWAQQHTPGGVAHSVLAVPYYRDDACFDDGTGSDPGPHVDPRDPDGDEPDDSTWSGGDRECWDADRMGDPDYADDLGSKRFYQGSIGTHGLHLLAVVDSDNAHTTAPVTEIDSEQRMVVLPGDTGNVGESYGRGPEFPLETTVTPAPFQASNSDGDPGADGQWLAGDLHVHTTYSHDSYGGPGDDNTSEEEAYTLGNSPEEQFAVASSRGLDYLAITDHNDVRSQQHFDESSGVLPIPGFENSLDGHAQMLGATSVDDYRSLGSDPAGVQAQADLLRERGGVFQVNHPAEGHTGGGQLDWSYGYDVLPDTVEVWNISRLYQPPAPSGSSNDDAVRYWEGWLDQGMKVGATGGSDNHYKATLAAQGPGQPTTWVFASEPTTAGVLEGLRAGRTFISHQPPGLGGPRIFLEADGDGDGSFESIVGDTVTPGSALRVRVEGAPGSRLHVIGDGGQPLFEPITVTSADFTSSPFTAPDATWLRAEIDHPDAQAERAAACDEQVGGGTTYCRNQLAVLAMTSALYQREAPAHLDTTIEYTGATNARGETVELAARLRDENGDPVADREVRFTIRDESWTATTNERGRAAVDAAVADHGRSVEVTVRFDGDDRYGASSDTATVTWGKGQGGPPAERLAAASGRGSLAAALFLAFLLVPVVRRVVIRSR